MSQPLQRGTDITGFKARYRDRNEGDFPDRLVLTLRKEYNLKYGENPNQHAAMYVLDSVHNADTVFNALGPQEADETPVITNGAIASALFARNASRIADLTDLVSVTPEGRGKGGLSLNNNMDITRAMQALAYFDRPSTVIMKHVIISGFATQTPAGESQDTLFRYARDGDRRSNFGGTAVFNTPLTMDAARAIFELKDQNWFVDVVAAPGYEDGVVGYISATRKDMRISQFSNLSALPRFAGDDTYGLLSIKEMPTGRFGVQNMFLTQIHGTSDLIVDPFVVAGDEQYLVGRDPSAQESLDMVTAHWLNVVGARSNGIVPVRNGTLLAMGAGQTERVGAVEQMIIKTMQKAMDREGITYDPLFGILGFAELENNPLEGAVVSSDAFFPFDDSIHLLGRMGVSGVVQPFGSLRDAQVITAINKYGMAGASPQGERCFGHF